MRAPLLPSAFVGVVDVQEIKSNGQVTQKITKDESGRVQKYYYHANGEIKVYEEWYKNRRHGIHTNYDLNGIAIESSWWTNGLRIESWKINSADAKDSIT